MIINYMESTHKCLSEHGIKPSVQRLAILNYIRTHRTHPTACEVYLDLLPDIPTLSKTTVYNTMKLFVNHGVALQLDIDGHNTRFDGVVDAHAHFYCKNCGRIYDLPLQNAPMPDTSGFVVDEAHVTIKGYCDKCKRNN